MKKNVFVIAILIIVTLLVGCESKEQTTQQQTVKSGKMIEMSISFHKQMRASSNQFAVWLENTEGEIVRTFFVTEFTANGGYIKREDSLPLWTEKSNVKEMESNQVDAIANATPKTGDLKYAWDCVDDKGEILPNGEYNFFVEGTIFKKGRVVYSGMITIGDTAQTVVATPEYMTEKSKNSDMISNVTASYILK